MNLIDKRLAELSGGRILDVATEGGGFLQKIIEADGSFDEAIGVDITDEHFAKGLEKMEGRPVSFVKMDGAALEFADESFDVVSMSAGLHHLTDMPGTLNEMVRVLKTGGHLIVREMIRDNQNEKQKCGIDAHHWHAKIDRLLGVSHNATLKKQEIVDLIEGLSLTSLEVREFNCGCKPEEDGGLEEELASIDEELARIENHPQYDELKTEGDEIRRRLKEIGLACPTQLHLVGVK